VITAERELACSARARTSDMLGMRAIVQGELLQVTNETRLLPRWMRRQLRACRSLCAAGDHERAAATSWRSPATKNMLVDDGNSAASFPETPILACCPGTGGLTRLATSARWPLRATCFCTTAEGIKGKRAKDWGLVEHGGLAQHVGRGVAERAQVRSPPSRP